VYRTPGTPASGKEKTTNEEVIPGFIQKLVTMLSDITDEEAWAALKTVPRQ